MRKIYLLLLTTLLGGALANAQNPLEGYEAPTGTSGNLGNIKSISTTGAHENLNETYTSSDMTRGYTGFELFAAPGATVTFKVNINTFWSRFAMFSDVNETKTIERLLLCGNPGTTTFQNESEGLTVYLEDNTNKVSTGTLPSVSIPADAAEGTSYLFRMIYFTLPDNSPSTEADWTYNGTYKEVQFYDIKITVKNSIQKYAINFTTPENGTLSIKNGATAITSGEEVAEGTILTVSATPNSGYELVAVKNNGEIFPNSTYAVTAAANFTAEFKQLATEGEAMLMSAPGYGTEQAQLRFSDTALGSHNTSENQVSSDQRSRNYTFSAWISPMGYNGVFMGHVQNSITWAVEGSYGIGVQDGKLAVWYRYWDGSSTGCPGASAPAVSETATLYPGEFAFISLVTSNDGKNFKVYNTAKRLSRQISNKVVGL